MDKNRFEYIIYIAFSKFFNFVGINASRRFAEILGRIFYYLIPIRRSVVRDNLKRAFPEYSEHEINSVARKCYQSCGITFAEMMLFSSMSKEELLRDVTPRSLDLLEEALKEGKGLLCLTAHFGNWELGALVVGVLLKRSINVLVKPQRNPYVNSYINTMRESFGNKSVSTGISVRILFRTLLKGGIIGVVGDQRGPKEARRVRFFKQDTAMYEGAAHIALRTGSPIIVTLIARQEDYTYKIHLERIPTLDLEGSPSEKALEVNRRYMSILESYIRKYPEQWLWMHKIWKY